MLLGLVECVEPKLLSSRKMVLRFPLPSAKKRPARVSGPMVPITEEPPMRKAKFPPKAEVCVGIVPVCSVASPRVAPLLISIILKRVLSTM